MFVNVLNSAVIFLAGIGAVIAGDHWSSTFAKENLSRFCPGSTGQMGVHVCADTVFAVSKNRTEDTGVEPESPSSQWLDLQRLTSIPDPVAAYTQLLGDTLSHRPASPELEIAYLLTRWPNLPQHIRQAIMTLVRSVDSERFPQPQTKASPTTTP